MDECIAPLGDVTIFSTLAANDRLWHIEISRRKRAKSVFASYHGLFQDFCISFEPKKALDTVWRAMDVISFTVLWEFALVI